LAASQETMSDDDRISTNKMCEGEVLTALSPTVCSYKCRNNLESFDEYVWVEIFSLGGLQLFTGNHYFPLDTKPAVITSCFHFLENALDTQHFNVFMGKDFNTSGFEWKHGLSLPWNHFTLKHKGDANYTSKCPLNFHQSNDAVSSSSSLLDLISVTLVSWA
jgi:hypothetical protein